MRRISIGRLTFGLSLGLVFGLLSGPAAASAEAGLRARVSGASPFAGCPSAVQDSPAPRGEVEPFVAVNPTDPRNVVAVWTQDQFRGLVAGVSFDSGATWRVVVVRGLTRCTGGSFDYVDDAWLSFGSDGTLHLYAKVFDASFTPSGAFALRSADGGLSWSQPTPLVMETNPRIGNFSGGAITADPSDPDRVYAVVPKFPRSGGRGGPSGGSVYFIRSLDGGTTWRPARKIFDAGKNRLATGHQIVVLPNGTLLDVFTLIRPRGTGRPEKHVALMRSTDEGRSWSHPTIVAELRSVGTTAPRTGDRVASGSALLTDAGVNRTSGRIYLVWQDARFHGGQADGIALISSPDGGLTWTRPMQVNATPAGIPITDQQAFTASVDVARNGAVAVSYSDFRHNDKAPGLRTDRWLVRCRPADQSQCTFPHAFASEVRLTKASFDMRRAPNLGSFGPGGFFLGDYMGLASAGGGFIAALSRPHGSDPASVFVRSGRPTVPCGRHW